jgi:hypothetical protein
MGKHKDSIVLEFLGLLRARGKTYKFLVEEEYPLIKNVFYADMVYKLSQDQMPIISFEVENRPTPYLIKNAVKYFGTSSNETPKPWHHFIIILRGKLSPSIKKALEGIVSKHNVHVFENFLLQKEEHERFDELLDKLAQGILAIEDRKRITTDFQASFSYKIEECTKLFEQGKSQEANDAIDQIIMLFKERIEGWDVHSVRFATKELFDKFYKYSEKNDFCELYTIFEDLFKYAYSQRRQLIGSMIESFDHILLETWIEGYDIEKGEKASKVMLRLGMDFFERDLTISKDCLEAIDNLAGDMFEPEILSKEILLCASAHQKSTKNPKLQDFVEQYTDWIRINDEYSWDAETKTYLRDSINYAEWEQKKYEVNVSEYKEKHLLPALEQNINRDLTEYVQFLGELESEGDRDLSFPIEELSKMILAYEFLRPRIASEIEELIAKEDNPDITAIFNNIIENSNFLKKMYRGSDMITTFDELLRFLESSADMENLNVGLTAYGPTWVDYKKRLTDEEKKAINEISQKYALQKDSEFELEDQRLTFLVDTLVYLERDRYDMRKFIDFLKEIDKVAEIKSLVTGIEFKLRQVK